MVQGQRKGSGKRKDNIKSLTPLNRYQVEEKMRLLMGRDQVLFVLLYLTGARLNEILDLKKAQIKEEDKHGKKFLVIYNVVTLKRGDRKFRRIDIRIDKEQVFVSSIISWINGLNEESYVFYDKRFKTENIPIKRSRAWQIIRNKTGLFPHFLRHIRLTHLVQDYGFGGYELQKFTGWKKLTTGENYVDLYGDFLAEKMANA